MSSQQSQLGAFSDSSGHTLPTADIELSNAEADTESNPHPPLLGFETLHDSTSPPPSNIQAARNVDYLCFTGRYPFVFDAARLGYIIGHREDLSYQWTPESVTLTTQFLDNDFEDPDLDRFTDRVFQYEPDVAVLGDITDDAALDRHLAVAEDIWASYPEMRLIIVPKSRSVLEDVPERFILGYPNGKSDIQATDVAPVSAWRGHDLHILGGAPAATWEEIKRLTKPTISGSPPANIVGLDYNGFARLGMQFGDYYSPHGGWEQHLRDTYLPKRVLLLFSLLNAKHFWWANGVWPSTDAPGRDGLPRRDTLLQAIQAPNDTSDGVTHHPTYPNRDASPAETDRTVLETTPVFTSPPSEVPTIRTDETQAGILEPQLPSALGGGDRYRPAGDLTTPAAHFTLPHAADIQPICVTCGGDIYDPSTCRGYRPATDTPSDHQLEALVVSYGAAHTAETNHPDSVAADGPEALTGATPEKTVAFCSDTCRKYAETRCRDLIPTEGAVVDGTILQRIHVAPN